jgi:phosphoglycolate phosphatase-like HAD superfamily hydrolase
MIGDSLSDIEFGHRLGMTTVFLEGDPGAPDEHVCSLEGDSSHRKPGADSARQLADLCFPSLVEATEALLNQSVKI